MNKQNQAIDKCVDCNVAARLMWCFISHLSLGAILGIEMDPAEGLSLKGKECLTVRGAEKWSGGGGERWSWSIFLQCSFAIQWRCLSTSNCSQLISINGIFLLSHSIRFSFSQILLDCSSETFSIGLLNNANAPLPYMDLCPPPFSLLPCISLPPLLSLHQFLQRRDREQWPTSSWGMSITLLPLSPRGHCPQLS